MSTPRTKVKACAICGEDFTAKWVHKLNRFTETCSRTCARQQVEVKKKLKAMAGD